MREQYVVELTDSAFFLSLLHIDADLSSLAKSAFKGKKLYLDSNIVYRLIGLQTESLQGMTQRVVDASKDFGCELLVSQLSINELRTSLDRAIRFLKNHPPLDKDYEKIKIQYSGEARGFIVAYWKEYEKNGTPLEHFANKYSNIDKILMDKFGIQITTNHIDTVMKDDQTNIEIKKFTNFLASKEQNKPISDVVIVPGELPRPEQLIHHDVRLLRIVEKDRGGACQKFGQANAWLLTADGDLISYSQHRIKKDSMEIPVAVHAKEWLLFLRPWLPRNEDYDKVFIELINTFANYWLETGCKTG